MRKLTSLVVGYDFSMGSTVALDAALALAKLHGATLTLVTAVPGAIDEDTWQSVRDKHANDLASDAEIHVLEDIEAMVRKSVELRDAEGVSLRFDIVEDDVSHGVCKAAYQYEADMIVVGATGWSGGERARIGSQTERIIRRSIWPVFVVRDNMPFPPKRFVVGTDYSDGSKVAIEGTIALARDFGASVHVVHCIDESPGGLSSFFRPQEPSAAGDIILERAERELAEFLAGFTAEGVTLTQEVIFGLAHRILPRVLREQDAQLLGLGSVGRSRLVELLVGGNAERIIRDLPASLLICKPDSFAFDLERGTFLQ